MSDESKIDDPISPNEPLRFNWEDYAQYLEECNLNDAQKQEFLETLWNIVVSFVDLGFGIHPIQRASHEPCGEDSELSSLILNDMISSTPIPQNKSNACAEPFKGASRKERTHDHK